MWTETSAIKGGLIKKVSFQPKKSNEVILSGSNIFINNAFYKVAREVVRNNSDFDNVYLKKIDAGYLPRTNFMVLSDESVKASIPETPWGTKYIEHYRLFTRKMIDSRGERTLISCIVPPGFMHTDAIRGVVFKSERKLCLNCAVWTSIVADFFIKTLGKENVNVDTIEMLGIGIKKYINEIILRILLLNCLNENYADLWEKMWSPSFNDDKWGKKDLKLNDKIFRTLTREWKGNKEFASEFCRRELQIELDVLVAMNVGLDLEDLLLMYRIQFPVMANYENDTWYDSCGDIIFSSKNYGGLTISRKEWNIVREGNADVQNGEYTYYKPYTNYDRKKDYEEVWETFKKRFSSN